MLDIDYIYELDEVIAKTDKSSLFELLETKVTDMQEKPKSLSAYLIDGQFLLHSLPPNLPPTYGGLARSMLHHSFTSSAKRVHIVFDDYQRHNLSPSGGFKTSPVTSRGSHDTTCHL